MAIDCKIQGFERMEMLEAYFPDHNFNNQILKVNTSKYSEYP